MKIARSLLSALSLSLLVSACASGVGANRAPADPSGTLSQVSLAEPAPAATPAVILVPSAVANDDGGMGSNIWAAARLGDRSQTER